MIHFYQVVAPERLEGIDTEDPPFLEEILTWTFRFGLPALANNLRVKYLGHEDMDEGDDEEEYYDEVPENELEQVQENEQDKAQPEVDDNIPLLHGKGYSGRFQEVVVEKVPADVQGAVMDDETDSVLGERIRVSC